MSRKNIANDIIQGEEQVENLDAEVEEDLSNDPDLKVALEHMNALRGTVTVEDLFFLMECCAEKERKIKELESLRKRESKVYQRIKFIAANVLKDLKLEKLDGPAGKFHVRHLLQVKMPGEERKEELWAWMRARGIYDKYATVQANSLKSLFETEMDIAAEEQGEDFDPITFTLPGMDPATFFDDLKFTPSKTRKKV
jgi:hypothetical protein